jgi:hypothetical protein
LFYLGCKKIRDVESKKYLKNYRILKNIRTKKDPHY